jgi:metallophosphoesterase (TIGR00282 family)
MELLFVGDIYGKVGRRMATDYLPRLKQRFRPALTIVNAENAAHGRGLTKKIYHQLLDVGADVLTMGNHTWDNREIFEFIDEADRLVRPANFPEGTPGTGMRIVQNVAVINLQGRTFLPPLDDPFRTADRLVQAAREKTPIIFVDIHAEATSEKMALARYLDGRVSAVIGTHTHVQTADDRILSGGTAYLTDVGMTGPYNGIIGVRRDDVLRRFLTQMPVRFENEEGGGQLGAVAIALDAKTGHALRTKRVLINDDHPFFD